MITKAEWLKAIEETRELWRGVHFVDDSDGGSLRNYQDVVLGMNTNCPFCLLVQSDCSKCIANVNDKKNKSDLSWAACSPHLGRISDSRNPEKKAFEILDQIETTLKESERENDL